MIGINNLTRSSIDKKFLKRVAEKVLKGENKEKGDLSITLVGLKRMQDLNKKYRGKNQLTDVLAFESKAKSFIKPLEIKELGEIVICPEIVKKNAKKYGTSFKKELSRILIHGILHLLGYEHKKSKKETQKMIKKQEYYLSQI